MSMPDRAIAPLEELARKFSLDEMLEALAYAGEGRTNSIKPDLLANWINRRISASLETPIAALDSYVEERVDRAVLEESEAWDKFMRCGHFSLAEARLAANRAKVGEGK